VVCCPEKDRRGGIAGGNTHDKYAAGKKPVEKIVFSYSKGGEFYSLPFFG